MNKLIPIFAMVAILFGGTLATVSATTAVSDVPDYRTTIKEVNMGRGDGMKIAKLWDSYSKMYTVVKYYNGFFVGKVKYMDSHKLVTPKKFWGTYDNGGMVGFLGKANPENMVYGKYIEISRGLSYWSLANLNGGVIHGYGLNMFN